MEEMEDMARVRLVISSAAGCREKQAYRPVPEDMEGMEEMFPGLYARAHARTPTHARLRTRLHTRTHATLG